MNQITFVGMVRRVFPIQQYTTKKGVTRLVRKFWAMESNSSNEKFRDVYEFEINQSQDNPSSNVAGVEDLDSLKQGHIIRFVFRNQGTLFTNSRTGDQQVWNKLLVCSRIELMESKRSYAQKNITKAVENFQKKQLVAAKAQAVMDNRDPDDVSIPF